MRDIQAAALEGKGKADLALKMFVRRVVKYIGAYYVLVGNPEALVFTGGIGENSKEIRQMIIDASPLKDKYAGVRLSWLADRLLEQGCVEALNLDGGGTACMYFNGKVVIQGQPNLRSMGSMIAFGLRQDPAE